MLIFCCGMPRSGSTLLYQLVSEIAEIGELAPGLGFARESYRHGVVKSEECCEWMIERVMMGEAIAIGSYRDFRDIIVSLRKFYNRRSVVRGSIARWTIEEVIRHEGQKILDDYYNWCLICDMWLRYESGLIKAILQEVPDYLGVILSKNQQQAIRRKYSLTRNIRRTKVQDVWIDTESMLTKAHISKTQGRSTWRDVLKQEEVTLIEDLAGDWLIEHNYESSPAS